MRKLSRGEGPWGQQSYENVLIPDDVDMIRNMVGEGSSKIIFELLREHMLAHVQFMRLPWIFDFLTLDEVEEWINKSIPAALEGFLLNRSERWKNVARGALGRMYRCKLEYTPSLVKQVYSELGVSAGDLEEYVKKGFGIVRPKIELVERSSGGWLAFTSIFYNHADSLEFMEAFVNGLLLSADDEKVIKQIGASRRNYK